MNKQHNQYALILWNYHKINHKLSKSDVIIGLGGHDTRVAERSAGLYLEGMAPLIIFTGGQGAWRVHPMNEPSQEKSEAERFLDIAVNMGVPKDKILVEDKSTNTGENIQFTKALLKKRKIEARSAILVNQPYMERRTYATFKKQWPELEILVTSPQYSFDAYCNKEISKEQVINKMVSDLQRIIIYPEKGYQIPQDIPQEVMSAYKKLIELGYTKGLAGG